MRTLVIGIPLPHVSFDNYSFLSAPSFADYRRIIVEIEGVSRVIEEAVRGDVRHATFAGQPVANVPASTAGSFALGEVLAMRAREAAWAVSQGATIVCFAHPDAVHAGIAGALDWRRYDWLPEPDGFSYVHHLLPAFGQPGVVLGDPGHPFARFVEAFGARAAYRAQIDDSAPAFRDGGAVFARSAGGLPVGASLRLGNGHLVLLPALPKIDSERSALADTLFQCLEEWQNRASPGLAREEVS